MNWDGVATVHFVGGVAGGEVRRVRVRPVISVAERPRFTAKEGLEAAVSGIAQFHKTSDYNVSPIFRNGTHTGEYEALVIR